MKAPSLHLLAPMTATQRGTSWAAVPDWHCTHPSHCLALLGELLLELSLHLLSVLYPSMRLRYNLLQIGPGHKSVSTQIPLFVQLDEVHLKCLCQLIHLSLQGVIQQPDSGEA